MDGEAFKQFRNGFYAGFPDLDHTIEDMIAEGDKVATRFTARGTHQGEFQGVPPTGKQIVLTGLIINRVAGDRIAEQWHEIDAVGLMQQIGAIPAPEGTTA